MKVTISIRAFRLIALLLFATAPLKADDVPANGTLLFQNLRKISSSIRVDNPSVYSTATPDGPKGLASADLNGDGWNDLVAANADGTIAILFGGPNGFETVRHLTAGDPRGLRDVITANVDGDARPEILAAHPFEGKVYIFSIEGGTSSRTFSTAKTLTTWPGARSLAAGDFNGDGMTDLAVGGAGNGFREYRGNGAGAFTEMPALSIAINAPPYLTYSAKPVFTLYTWRHPGETRDRLVLSFANAGKIWFLNTPATGQALAITSELTLLPNESVYDLALAYVSAESRSRGEPDLLTAVTWSGEIFIRHHNPAPNGIPYTTIPQERLAVPGAPRALSIADVNGDTWPDLLVAARTGNTISLYLNTGGTLSYTSQSPAGSSPRDVISADFDGNGLPDAAVINRQSEDITIHRIDPVTGWFYQSPLVQKIIGGASAPKIVDLDGDGTNELLYLTSFTGEVNIQKLNGTQFTTPVRYTMGVRPQTLSTPDLNGDKRADLLSTNLGDSQRVGGLSYRLQLPDKTFGPLFSVPVADSSNSAMFAEIARDFTGDGLLDLIVGYYDCRVAFFEGTANGLIHRRTEFFVYESRALAVADMDQDGDLDLIGVGSYGDLAVVENLGSWFSGGPFRKTLTGDKPVQGAYGLSVEDRNGDGYPDLTVLSYNAVTRWTGAPGLVFELESTSTLLPTLDSTTKDFDGDGIADYFALCPAATTASFFKGTENSAGQWWTLPYVQYGVPSVLALAAGDLDGDNRPDLVGAGEHLWAVLSGSPAPAPVPTANPLPRIDTPAVVINEILASTTDFIPAGAASPVDCVEIFNGTGSPVNLAGWKLRRVAAAGENQASDFIFPADFTLPPRGIALVYCTANSGAWQAPFKLPEEGCTLSLLTAAGENSDTVAYPAQRPDVSYARLFDGSQSFVFNPFPSIGSTNYDNGSPQPKVAFKGVDTTLLKSGKWRFRANVWAPNGMFTLLVSWREITTSRPPRSGTIALFDDGMHDDGDSLDGAFTGDWTNPLPAGTPIEFYITGTDLRWEASTEPNSPAFTPANEPIQNYTLALPAVASGWEISEVVPRNNTGLQDERGDTPDWIELRYTGTTTASVENLFLSDTLFGFKSEGLYNVARLGDTVLPGNSRVVFLDGSASTATPPHAPFKVNGDGDSIYLIHRLASGATELVDVVKVPELSPDTAFARMGVGGPFVPTKPTPGSVNAPSGGSIHLVPGASGGKECLFAYPGGGSVEASSDLKTWTTVLPSVPKNGTERTYREPINSSSRFFRVR